MLSCHTSVTLLRGNLGSTAAQAGSMVCGQSPLRMDAVSSYLTAVHQQKPAPLSIYTRIYFLTKNRPEIGPATPFGAVAAGLGNITAADDAGQIYPAFKHGNANVGSNLSM
jgi:hypothetical protein